MSSPTHRAKSQRRVTRRAGHRGVPEAYKRLHMSWRSMLAVRSSQLTATSVSILSKAVGTRPPLGRMCNKMLHSI
jgi:hypothetical protein